MHDNFIESVCLGIQGKGHSDFDNGLRIDLVMYGFLDKL